MAGAVVAADDVGDLGGVGGEAFGEGEGLEDGGFVVVLEGESAGLFDVADDEDLAELGDADLLAAVEGEVDVGIGGIDLGLDGNAAGEGDGGAIGAGLGVGDEDLGTGFGGETAGAGDGFEEGDVAHGLEGGGTLDGAGDADGAAIVLDDGDGDVGVDQDLLGLEGGGDGGFELGGEEAFGVDELLEHGEADGAIGVDTDGAGELGGVVDGDGDQVVGADFLGGEVGAAGVGDGWKAGLGRGGEGQEEKQECWTHKVPWRRGGISAWCGRV